MLIRVETNNANDRREEVRGEEENCETMSCRVLKKRKIMPARTSACQKVDAKSRCVVCMSVSVSALCDEDFRACVVIQCDFAACRSGRRRHSAFMLCPSSGPGADGHFKCVPRLVYPEARAPFDRRDGTWGN